MPSLRLRHCIRHSARTRLLANLACYALALVALGASPRLHLDAPTQQEAGMRACGGRRVVAMVKSHGDGRVSMAARRVPRGPVAEDTRAPRAALGEPSGQRAMALLGTEPRPDVRRPALPIPDW